MREGGAVFSDVPVTKYNILRRIVQKLRKFQDLNLMHTYSKNFRGILVNFGHL